MVSRQFNFLSSVLTYVWGGEEAGVGNVATMGWIGKRLTDGVVMEVLVRC